MPLHISHRPADWEDVVGNAATIKALQTLLGRKNDIPHSMMFYGPSGCGKTTLARIVASKLDIDAREVNEINAADFRGIDTIRSIRDQAMYRPIFGSGRAWIFDECHQLSKDAQSALLKLTEDAPKNAYFFFATTDPQKMLPTLRSRCHQFQVESLDASLLESLVRRALKIEKVSMSDEIVEKIAANAMGSPRNAMVLLDKIIDLDDKDALEVLDQSIGESAETIELCRALLKREKWKRIAEIIKNLTSSDPEQIRYAVLGYCSAIVLSGKMDAQAIIILDIFSSTNFMYSGKAGLIVACLKAIEE